MLIDAVEIEPEWASMHPSITLGNALHLPWPPDTFDAIVTSPPYGNRLSDSLIRPLDQRMNYAQSLRRPLHPNNSGSLQWGDAYRTFHLKAWTEATRVLQPGGSFILNVKNHIRDHQEQFVSEWHVSTLESLGYTVTDHETVHTPSMRHGRNYEKRINDEHVYKLTLHK